MIRVLKPFPNFESRYQGVSGTFPIAFPGVLDNFSAAGTEGYDPNLIAGMTVPLGSQISIWIPQTIEDGIAEEGPPIVNALYQYQILWRMRSIKDYNVGQAKGQMTPTQDYSSYHLRNNALGQPQSQGQDPALKRYFLAGAIETIVLTQTEPSGGVPVPSHLRGQYLQTVADPIWVPPLTPSGASAVWQQGAYTRSNTAACGGPSFLIYTTVARGDEMAILASKIDTDNPWDFTATDPGDVAFSNTYGNNNSQNFTLPTGGILVTTGKV